MIGLPGCTAQGIPVRTSISFAQDAARGLLGAAFGCLLQFCPGCCEAPLWLHRAAQCILGRTANRTETGRMPLQVHLQALGYQTTAHQPSLEQNCAGKGGGDSTKHDIVEKTTSFLRRSRDIAVLVAAEGNLSLCSALVPLCSYTTGSRPRSGWNVEAHAHALRIAGGDQLQARPFKNPLSPILFTS